MLCEHRWGCGAEPGTGLDGEQGDKASALVGALGLRGSVGLWFRDRLGPVRPGSGSSRCSNSTVGGSHCPQAGGVVEPAPTASSHPPRAAGLLAWAQAPAKPASSWDRWLPGMCSWGSRLSPEGQAESSCVWTRPRWTSRTCPSVRRHWAGPQANSAPGPGCGPTQGGGGAMEIGVCVCFLMRKMGLSWQLPATAPHLP